MTGIQNVPLPEFALVLRRSGISYCLPKKNRSLPIGALMSYEDAISCFAENLNELESPSGSPSDEDVRMLNLYNGLIALTRAIQEDLASIQHSLQLPH